MKITHKALRATIKASALSIILIATLGSCKKGDTGAAGINGTNGNANVLANTLTVNPSDWHNSSANWEYYVDFTDDQITQDVVDNGTVSIFFSVFSGTGWQAIPYTYYYNSTTSLSFGYNYILNGGSIFINISNTSTFTFATYTFKIVAIGGAQRKAHPHTNWNNYNEVKAALGISLIETTITPSKIK